MKLEAQHFRPDPHMGPQTVAQGLLQTWFEAERQEESSSLCMWKPVEENLKSTHCGEESAQATALGWAI